MLNHDGDGTWMSPQSIEQLRERAQFLASIREFFSQRQVLEVDVPVIGRRTVTDPYIQAISCTVQQQALFLQTSPEYFMKRLLAGGAPSIYYLGKAFRDDQIGRVHNPEFSMLEWYRLGFDDSALMAELRDFLHFLKPGVVVETISYAALFTGHFQINPHVASAQELASLARQRIELDPKHFDVNDKNLWLDLLFSHFIEPTLLAPTIVFDYPASQCALARVMPDQQGRQVAKRFELFWQGIELANAYWELADAELQQERFAEDLRHRKTAGLEQPAMDEKLLAAMKAGLPDCAGIALGVDRLFMCLQNLPSIDKALSFSAPRL